MIFNRGGGSTFGSSSVTFQNFLVRPFHFTVDKEGADYMRAMCEDLPYELVTRVEDLLTSLLTAYPKITA